MVRGCWKWVGRVCVRGGGRWGGDRRAGGGSGVEWVCGWVSEKEGGRKVEVQVFGARKSEQGLDNERTLHT